MGLGGASAHFQKQNRPGSGEEWEAAVVGGSCGGSVSELRASAWVVSCLEALFSCDSWLHRGFSLHILPDTLHIWCSHSVTHIVQLTPLTAAWLPHSSTCTFPLPNPTPRPGPYLRVHCCAQHLPVSENTVGTAVDSQQVFAGLCYLAALWAHSPLGEAGRHAGLGTRPS